MTDPKEGDMEPRSEATAMTAEERAAWEAFGHAIDTRAGPIEVLEARNEVRRAILAATPPSAHNLALDDVAEAVGRLPTWDKRAVPGGFHVSRAAVLRIIEEARRG